MKIAYCISATHNSGGMERVLFNKVKHLVEVEKYDISIITTDQKGKEPYFLFPNGVNFYDLSINYCDDINLPILIRKSKLIHKRKKHKKRLDDLLKINHFDIVISMMCDDFYFLHKIHDKSIKIAEFHFTRFSRLPRAGLKKYLTPLYKKREVNLAKKYSKIILLTNEEKKSWPELNNIEVIPNSLIKVPQNKSDLNSKIVTAIGRFTYDKGFDELIYAWKEVSKKNPDWVLQICGDGELKELITELISKLGLTSTIKYIPPTQHIEEVYLDTAIYVMTSRSEGLPMVLIEASSYGLPLVVFDCPCGPREIVIDRFNGFLIPNRDVKEFSNAIDYLIKDDALRKLMGENAKISVIEKFNNTKIMNQWVSLFTELISKK